jgi:predicted nucleotide-binding protein
MPMINPRLLDALVSKTGLSRGQVYARIQQVANRDTLPRDLAAVKLTSEVGVTINKYADAGQLAQLRQAGSPVMPPGVGTPAQPHPARTRDEAKGLGRRRPGGRAANQVFIVHGRDVTARDALCAFIRALGVKPIEWNSAIAMSRKAAPYVGEILDNAYKRARAIVVLLTPDDLVQLRPDLLSGTDKPYERVLTGQARPNVLFEAGLAFGTHPDQTVMVQIGNVKEFSDVGGRHVVHMTNHFEKRQQLALKLRNAGCDVDMSGSDWVKAGDFTDPQARALRPGKRSSG